MNVLGLVVIWALSAVLVAWVFDLVRRDRLYVGYGVIFVGAVIAGLALISLPRVLGALSGLWIRVEPASGFYDLVLLFMLVLLIYAFNQMTLLSNRVATLIQELAIRDADIPRDRASGPHEP